MKFYSTKGQTAPVDLKTAVIQGLPTDNGLFMPEVIRPMDAGFFDQVHTMSFGDMAFQLAERLLNGTIDSAVLEEIVHDTLNFEAPVVPVTDNMACLELFHGPSLAFKDFGARFMARLMGHFVKDSSEKLYILVATSGDTGGAVAQGFLDTPGIEVVILYPSGKVSDLQEKQLTTLGSNISTLEVQGTFDDCQKMVKSAFLDADLRSKINISSANSINIARLIPQSFYYLYAYSQVSQAGKPVVFSIPSGNFGNITAGLMAAKMGLPVHRFIASNNANDVFREYLEKGVFTARPSVPTHSNAMDVGNPSNLQRIQDLYGNDVAEIRKVISAYAYTDEQTIAAVKEAYTQHDYVQCPHTAVAYLGLQDYIKEHGEELSGIFLGTAHPSKFLDIVEDSIQTSVDIPERLACLKDRKKEALLVGTEYEELRAYLVGRMD